MSSKIECDFSFVGKTIALLSPQPWEGITVSKHHYAKEIARRGAKVYFVNPIKTALDTNIHIYEPFQNCHVVQLGIPVPYFTKFHWRSVFDWAVNWQVKRLRRAIKSPIDIVWDFDCNLSYTNYKAFEAKLHIFHPVDQSSILFPKSKTVDCIFSVSPVILDHYKDTAVPKYFINHGLSGPFEQLATKQLQLLDMNHNSSGKQMRGDSINAGYVGNLMIPTLDRRAILEVVHKYANLSFHFWGPYNSTGTDDAAKFIHQLTAAPNVSLHGKATTSELAEVLPSMDVLFYAYQRSSNYNADNSHKVLEYLSTGKTVVGSALSVYADNPLIEQAHSSQEWVSLFGDVILRLDQLNTTTNAIQRMNFALSQVYEKQVDRALAFISKL